MTNTPRSRRLASRLLGSQEGIVFVLAATAFVVFALALPGFATPGNLVSLVRSVSVLGILALGMAIVVIGRGIDVAMIATMVVSVSWAFVIARTGYPLAEALVIGGAFALVAGILIGALIAYGDVPPIFATLAAGSIIYGLGRTFFFTLEMQNVPPGNDWFDFIGKSRVLGVPVTVIAFAVLCALAHFALTSTRFGWQTYAMGSNPNTARTTGVPMRAMVIAHYALSALVAYVAGLILASSASAINARLYNSTMIYDILLVIVLGGIGLNGGAGRIRNVVLGTIFVGILLNGMTILDVPFTIQNLVKGVVLLLAIVFDSLVNPRDEQTSQQGDL
ncbi:ribose transport system permease protein [Roseiarcus fermentans]|uniref:Ribose transport system permease protein n=1 Tax=Roseiarcus fermentans TaxID=1473586 RepID=A0A366FWX5_9HYPH|nr:ABC transporter permease [Roseiarcus fermentans]RBP18199.1 ribose transport system permease protein [Roseiarcus fermentans]